MKKNAATPSSVIIICFRFLGDVLVTTPLALSIKAAYPDAAIDYLVFKGTEKILDKNPLVRKVLTIDKDTSGIRTLLSLYKKYDIAFAAYPSDRTVLAAAISGKYSIGLDNGQNKEWWKHVILNDCIACNNQQLHVVANVLALAKAAGIQPQPRLVMGFDSDDEEFVRKKLKTDTSPYIILHPYSRGAYKCWSPEKWGALAEYIQSQTKLRPIFTVTPDKADLAFLTQIAKATRMGIMQFPEAFTLNQLAAAIKGGTAYIGVDTAASHIAAAVGTPTIVLFGSTWTKYWAPWPNGCHESSPFQLNKGIQRKGLVTVVQKDWECVPCNQIYCAISSRNRTECLEELNPEEVLSVLQHVLEQL